MGSFEYCTALDSVDADDDDAMAALWGIIELNNIEMDQVAVEYFLLLMWHEQRRNERRRT